MFRHPSTSLGQCDHLAAARGFALHGVCACMYSCVYIGMYTYIFDIPKTLHTYSLQALLRPGRFDRQIPIEVPVLPERKAIFELYLKKLPLEHPPEQYASRLAALTPGHTGEQHIVQLQNVFSLWLKTV